MSFVSSRGRSHYSTISSKNSNTRRKSHSSRETQIHEEVQSIISSMKSKRSHRVNTEEYKNTIEEIQLNANVYSVRSRSNEYEVEKHRRDILLKEDADDLHSTVSETERLRMARKDLDALYFKRREELERSLKNVAETDSQRRLENNDENYLRRRNHQLGEDMLKQLKRVTIPIFYGDKRTYSGWKAAFYTCVDATDATPEYKLLQLRSYLKGEALKSIELLGHSAAAYEAAKRQLERKFGGERRQMAMRLEELDLFKPIRPGFAKDVEKLADLLEVLIVSLKDANKTEELGDGILYIKIQKKLSEEMLIRYKRWTFENDEPNSVESLQKWLLRESDYQNEAWETIRGISDRTPRRQDYTNYGEDSIKPGSCLVCSEFHTIWNCENFANMDVNERWDIAKGKKLCFGCLSSSHLGKDCLRTQQCGVDGCKRTHHQLLHKERRYVTREEQSQNNQLIYDEKTANFEEERSHIQERSHNSYSGSIVSLRTVPVILKSGNRRVKINALLDDGSTKSYINNDVAKELQLNGKPEIITVGTLDGRTRTFKTEEVKFEVMSIDGKTSNEMNAFTTNKVTGNLKATEWRKESKEWKHIAHINFPLISKRKAVDLLIGSDYPELHLAIQEVQGKLGEPIARRTPLGWTCVGNIKTKGAPTHHIVNFNCFANINDIDITLERFWEIKELEADQKRCMSTEETDDDDAVNSIIRKDHSNQYQIESQFKSELIKSTFERLISTGKSTTEKGEIQNYDEIIHHDSQTEIDKQQESKEISKTINQMDLNNICISTTDKAIKCSMFPLAPHFGRVHESMVKSAKRTIYAVVKNADVNDEELHSVFVGVEDLLNSRPITYQSSNAADDLHLTANHFIHDRVGGEFVPSNTDKNRYNMRKRWRRVEDLVTHFWDRWIREWLPERGKRQKWTNEFRNLKTGDLLLVIERDTPRRQWNMGIIENTYPSNYSHVRTVKVNIKGSSYIRPITKLCHLEMSIM